MLQKVRDPEFASLLIESEAVNETKKVNGKTGPRRGRKTEKQEDAELLAVADEKEGDGDGGEDPFVFEQSPACRSSRSFVLSYTHVTILLRCHRRSNARLSGPRSELDDQSIPQWYQRYSCR